MWIVGFAFVVSSLWGISEPRIWRFLLKSAGASRSWCLFSSISAIFSIGMKQTYTCCRLWLQWACVFVVLGHTLMQPLHLSWRRSGPKIATAKWLGCVYTGPHASHRLFSSVMCSLVRCFTHYFIQSRLISVALLRSRTSRRSVALVSDSAPGRLVASISPLRPEGLFVLVCFCVLTSILRITCS